MYELLSFSAVHCNCSPKQVVNYLCRIPYKMTEIKEGRHFLFKTRSI